MKIRKVEVFNEIKKEFKSKSPSKTPTEEIKLILEDLYVDNELSQTKIAKIFEVQRNTIARWLKRCGTPLRNRYDSVSISLSKFKTKPFSNNLNEKSYLVGMRYGDLSSQLHGRKIRISVSSTHPAMLNLFEKLFSEYGKVNFYPKYGKLKKRHIKCVYCDLDYSFNFLMHKSDKIPKWVIRDDKLFYSFLSGYFDAEGCISICKDGKYWNVQWILKSCDKKLLEDALNKLKQLGFILNFRLAKKADYKTYNKDYWYLGTGRRLQVLELLKLMNLRHEEKVLKCKLLNNLFQ